MTQWRWGARCNVALIQGATSYLFFIESNYGGASETLVQTKFYVAYTISALRILVTANGGTSTVAFRDDGVTSSNQVLSITTTGWLEDVTGTDTPAANSLCNIIAKTGGSHGNNMTLAGGMLTYEHASTMAPLMAR